MSDSPTKRLERIANEYIHMQYLVDRAGPDLPFIRSLQPVSSSALLPRLFTTVAFG